MADFHSSRAAASAACSVQTTPTKARRFAEYPDRQGPQACIVELGPGDVLPDWLCDRLSLPRGSHYEDLPA